MKSFLRLFQVSIVLIAGVALGCSQSSRLWEGERPVRIQIPTDPVTLDPTLAEDGLSLRLLSNSMEGLMRSDAEGNIVPGLASEIDLNREGTVYRFKIKSDLKWSDGRPLRLEDFVTAFRRARDPKVGAKLAHFLDPLVDGDRAVRLEGDQLIIELKRRTAHFLGVLTLPLTFPLREDVLQSSQGKWPENGPSIGKYILTEQKRDQWVKMKPREGVKGLPIDWIIVRDESTALALYESGKLDVVSRVPALDISRLDAKGEIRRDPFLANYYLGFTVKHPELRTSERRRALSRAIDRRTLVQLTGGDDIADANWLPQGLVDRGQVGAVSVSGPLSRSPFGKEAGVALELRFDSSSKNQAIAERVQAEWLQQLGVKTRLVAMDWKSHIGSLKTDPPAVFRMGWMTPFKDPLPHLKAMTSKSPYNYTGWSNADYDRLVDEIESMPTNAERNLKVLQAEKILIDQEAVIAPLFQAVLVHAVKPGIRGFLSNPFGLVDLSKIERVTK